MNGLWQRFLQFLGFSTSGVDAPMSQLLDELKVVPPTSEARKGTIETSEHLIRLVSLLDRLNFQIVELSLAGREYEGGKGGSLKALRADTTLALATAQAIVELIETDVELIETDTTHAFLSYDEKLQKRVYEALTKGLVGAYLDEKKSPTLRGRSSMCTKWTNFLTVQRNNMTRFLGTASITCRMS